MATGRCILYGALTPEERFIRKSSIRQSHPVGEEEHRRLGRSGVRPADGACRGPHRGQLSRFPLCRRPLFRRPPFLHCDGQGLSSRCGKATFLDWHRSLPGCRRNRSNRYGSRRSSFRRPHRRPAFLCRCNNRPSARSAQLSLHRCCRTYRPRRRRVRLDRRRYRLSTRTRWPSLSLRTLKGLNRSG
jgi:hypothetical protein